MDRLNTALSQLPVKYTDQINRLNNLSWAERGRLLRELDRSMSSDWLRVASQILTPAQLEYFTQHALEVRSLMSLSDAELQRKLSLTSEQLQQMQSMRDQARRELGKLPLLARENLREADRRHLAYRQRWFEAANTILDGAQRRMWRDMDNGNFNFRPNIASPERR